MSTPTFSKVLLCYFNFPLFTYYMAQKKRIKLEERVMRGTDVFTEEIGHWETYGRSVFESEGIRHFDA